MPFLFTENQEGVSIGFQSHHAIVKDGAIYLPHGSEYQVYIRNENSRRIVVDLNIDGKIIGSFLCRAVTTVVIQRPAKESRKFTFFRSGSSEATESNESKIPQDNKGLLQATVFFEKESTTSVSHYGHQGDYDRYDADSGCTTLGYHTSPLYRSQDSHDAKEALLKKSYVKPPTDTPLTLGITGLGARSTQTFTTVNFIRDESSSIHFSFRLYCLDEPSIPLQEIEEIEEVEDEKE